MSSSLSIRASIGFTLLALMMPFFAFIPSAEAVACPTLHRDLERGMEGNDVLQLQQFLVETGFLSQADMNTGPGFFGSRTKLAVQRFQSNNGVPSTGYVGPITRAAIARVCSGGGGGGGGGVPSSITMTASPVSGNAPLSVSFQLNASAGGACKNYILDFGDGRSENLSNFCGTRTINHSFTVQGSYAVRLDEYVNNGGQLVRVEKARASISVGAPVVVVPTCTMSASRTSITPNQSVTLTWSSTNATSATWGDGGTTGTSGSAIFTNITTTTTKSINFTGTGGSRSCSVTITVTTPVALAGVLISGNAVANGSVIALTSGTQNNVKLADFTVSANGTESVVLKSMLFTLRNQATSGSGSAATVSNYRTSLGGTTYSASSTVDGIYTDNSVAVGSGVPIAQGGSLVVSILADITTLVAGTLDLWIYPEDMKFIGATSGTNITASSTVTNRNDPALLYWSGWISTGGGGGSGTACYMNGVRHAIDPEDSKCSPWTSGGNFDLTTLGQCREWYSTPRCSINGWANVSWGGGYINPQNVTVGCTTHNGLYVPGNMRVHGNRCTDQNRDANATSCEWNYVCKRDGWWRLDGAGFELEHVSEAPWVAPETFSPPIDITP